MNSVIPINTVKVLDPVIDIRSERTFAIVDGGEVVTNSQQPAQSYSNQQVIFNLTVVPGTIIDRKMFFNGRFSFTLSGPTVGAIGTTLLVAGGDAPRAFPLSNIFQNIQMKINNNTVSLPLNRLISAMQRYNKTMMKNNEFSSCPTYADQSQNYADLKYWIRNPLNTYGDSEFNEHRGGFPFTFVDTPSTVVNGPASAVVTIEITEEIQISPLLWGMNEGPGFVNVDNLSFTFTLDANLQRVWSHDAISYPGYIFSNFQWLNAPSMFLKQITPKLLDSIPEAPVYNYYSLEVTTQDFLSVPANTLSPITSQVIEFSSIPSKIYIFMRKNDSLLSMNDTDSFFSLEALNVKFGNHQGLFSGATKQELYNISRKNGCNLSWEQWQGIVNTSGSVIPPVVPNGKFNAVYGTVGAVFCMDLARDMGLASDEAPGINGRYQFQLQTGTLFKNINQSQAVAPTLYIVGVQDGTFTLMKGNSINQIGVISKMDVLSAQSSPSVTIDEVSKLQGSSFLSALQDVGKFIKDKKVISTGLKLASDVVPHPAAQFGLKIASQGAEQLGYGYAPVDRRGGALLGGRRMTRSEMRNML